MLFSYDECLKLYGNDYQIKKAIKLEKLFKLDVGIYSDQKNVVDTAIISKKYPNAVFTMNSAFYYHGLTDTIPSFYYLITDKDASKIKNKVVKQIFDNNCSLNLGIETIFHNNDYVRVFSKERMLVELIRSKNKLPFDYYKEIINSYRRLIYELDFQLVEEYAEKLPKTNMVMDTIAKEVF